MNLTQKLLGLASLALASISIAQTTTTTTSAASLLGVRYAEASFDYINFNHSNRGAYVLGAAVNAPISANLDLTADYSHLSAENNDSLYGNQTDVNLTAYLSEGALRPFVTGGLGYLWESNAIGGDDYGIWNVGAGAEYSFSTTTAVTLSASYDDSLRNQDDHQYSSTARVHHWFTSAIAGTIGVTWIEGGNFGYSASAIFKF